MKLPLTFKPDASVLPKLLDSVAEEARLKSINDLFEKNWLDGQKSRRLSKILQGRA